MMIFVHILFSCCCCKKKASSKRFIKHSFKILSCQTSCSICLVYTLCVILKNPKNYIQKTTKINKKKEYSFIFK